MLRFGIFASVIPLLLTGGIVRDWFPPDYQPCIPAGTANVQLARPSSSATRSVSFTNDPATATIKVQIVDGPELADLAIVDDAYVSHAQGCATNSMTRTISITREPVAGEPVIHMSRNPGDYRVYLSSKRMSFQEAAALIVGARGGPERLTAAAFRVLPSTP